MTRRIVQIATSAIPQFESAHPSCFAVYALCDDGSLWTQAMAEKEWLRLPDIPQDAPAEDPIAERIYRGPGCVDNPEFVDDPDSIAEIEAMGGRLFASASRCRIYWSIAESFEDVTADADSRIRRTGVVTSDVSAAAARLLARVRGEKS